MSVTQVVCAWVGVGCSRRDFDFDRARTDGVLVLMCLHVCKLFELVARTVVVTGWQFGSMIGRVMRFGREKQSVNVTVPYLSEAVVFFQDNILLIFFAKHGQTSESNWKQNFHPKNYSTSEVCHLPVSWMKQLERQDKRSTVESPVALYCVALVWLYASSHNSLATYQDLTQQPMTAWDRGTFWCGQCCELRSMCVWDTLTQLGWSTVSSATFHPGFKATSLIIKLFYKSNSCNNFWCCITFDGSDIPSYASGSSLFCVCLFSIQIDTLKQLCWATALLDTLLTLSWVIFFSRLSFLLKNDLVLW